jgi:hypothetical protein
MQHPRPTSDAVLRSCLTPSSLLHSRPAQQCIYVSRRIESECKCITTRSITALCCLIQYCAGVADVASLKRVCLTGFVQNKVAACTAQLAVLLATGSISSTSIHLYRIEQEFKYLQYCQKSDSHTHLSCLVTASGDQVLHIGA